LRVVRRAAAAAARRARGVPVLRRWAVSVPVPSLCTLTRPEARFRATPLEAHSARCSACAARARVLSSLANAPAHVRGRQERTGAGRGVGRAGHAEHWPIQHARTHARTLTARATETHAFTQHDDDAYAHTHDMHGRGIASAGGRAAATRSRFATRRTPGLTTPSRSSATAT
jgi:hypothetical protein